MMDSRTPSTPVTPYGQNPNQYKVNVSRQKTRKWVEAKTQNYDGDDWGADDDFDDLNDNDVGFDGGSPEVLQAQQVQIHPQRPGRLTAGLRAISASGASTPLTGSAGSSPSLRPSERIALERQQAALQRSVTGPPALHVHTLPSKQTSPIPQVAGPPGPTLGASATFPPRKSSMAGQERPDFADPAARPPRTSSRSQSPTGALRSPVSATGPPKVIRPAEIYKRMEQEKEKERSSMESSGRPSLDSTGRIDGDSDSATNPPRRPSFGMNDPGDSSRGLRPLEPVAERKSEYGFDSFIPPPQGAPNNNGDKGTQPGSEAQAPTLQHPQARRGLHPGNDPMKRYSTSPTLPQLSRMSGFGGDFFGAGGLSFTNDTSKGSSLPADSTPEQPQSLSITNDPATATNPAARKPSPGPSSRNLEGQPAPSEPTPIRPSLPGGWVTETPTPGETATPGVEQATQGDDLVANANASNVPSINEHFEDAHMHDESQHNRSGRISPTNLEKQGDADPTKNDRDVQEPQPTSDPDALGIAPLQPRKGSVPESPPEDLRPFPQRADTYSTMDNSSPLKESDFLRDEIMRSLSPARPADEFTNTPQDDATRESAYLDDVYGDYWAGEDKKRETEGTAEQSGKGTGEPGPTSTAGDEPAITSKPPVQTWTSETPSTNAEPTAAKPELNRERFSWEGGAEPKQPPSESPKDPAGSTSAAGPPDPTSPVDVSLLELPALQFADSDMNSRVVSEVSELSPGPRQSIAELPSPLSNIGNRDGPATATGDHDSHMDDKIVVQSPMSPMSPMEPIGMQDNDDQLQDPQRTGTPAEAVPEGVPLPRSPSPTMPRSQPAYNSMTLKQILQLPTSEDRVLKMRETREHFSGLDSGLAGWLSEMLTHESHENAMPTFNYALSGADAELWGTKGGARIPLNAPADEGGQGGGQSNAGGGGNVTHIGRSASGSVNLGNLVMHSGQAGAKGKELLFSAGKLSKGLLSKGKNKLRERAESKKG